jgi:hypothetical protein
MHRPNLLRAHEVIRVGANFAGDVSQYADAFDKLIDQSNERIRTLNDTATRENRYKNILAWINIGLTVLVTILAAIAGVNPQEAQNPSGAAKRSKIIIAIAIIAALASGSQLFVDKLDKDTQAQIGAAIELSNATSLSRTEFLRAKKPEEAIRATSDLQQALLKSAIV